MKFRTEITFKGAPEKLSPERLIVLLGSCFADNIGERIAASGWPCVANPCGTLYNPCSILEVVRVALMHESKRSEYLKSLVAERDGKYVVWLMGARCAGTTVADAIANAESILSSLGEALKKCEALVLTLGTPDIWWHKEREIVVGNCHKHSASEFEKRRLSVAETVECLHETERLLHQVNPRIRIILTVSPRRYLAEGMADNSVQKATLLLACSQLSENEGSAFEYFPAYEILMDDLRDYRFYDSDLLHPSPSAIEYIWECFCSRYLTPADVGTLKIRAKERKRLGHRPITQ